MNMQSMAREKTDSAGSVSTPRRGVLRRKCACGGSAGPSGECSECGRKRLPGRQLHADQSIRAVKNLLEYKSGIISYRSPSILHALGKLDQSQTNVVRRHGGHSSSLRMSRCVNPGKSEGVIPGDRDRVKPPPTQGSATIICDGSGGYKIKYGSWAGAKCGTKKCVTAHESSHMADWKAKWPTGCKGQPLGYLPKGDPPDKPLMTVAEYNSFLKKSECKAHTVDLACAQALPKTKGCESTIDDYIKLTRDQKKNWCPEALSRGAKVGIGIGAGALTGAGIGFIAGGPLGAAIGAGIGGLVGGIAGALF